jgi:CBS-domain-containing membrane protein
MSIPIVMITEDRMLTETVDLMLFKGVKRLLVVDDAGRLVGMLSRLDIFRTVMREKPDLNAFRAQKSVLVIDTTGLSILKVHVSAVQVSRSLQRDYV